MCVTRLLLHDHRLRVETFVVCCFCIRRIPMKHMFCRFDISHILTIICIHACMYIRLRLIPNSYSNFSQPLKFIIVPDYFWAMNSFLLSFSLRFLFISFYFIWAVCQPGIYTVKSPSSVAVVEAHVLQQYDDEFVLRWIRTYYVIVWHAQNALLCFGSNWFGVRKLLKHEPY